MRWCRMKSMQTRVTSPQKTTAASSSEALGCSCFKMSVYRMQSVQKLINKNESMLISRDHMIFQGSRTIIKAEKRPPNSSSSLLHGSCGLFLQSERMIAHHTPLQKQQHPHIVSRECWCGDVAWRACKPGWQAPRKQPQPPPVKLWDVPASKWALAAFNQFNGVGNYSPNVSNMSPTCRQWMIVSRSCMIFQGSRTMIKTCAWIQQSDSSLLHCSFGLFLKQSELIQSHFDNNSVHFVSNVLMPTLNYTLFQDNNQTKSIDHSSEKATPGSSVEHIEPLGWCSCRLSAFR